MLDSQVPGYCGTGQMHRARLRRPRTKTNAGKLHGDWGKAVAITTQPVFENVSRHDGSGGTRTN